MVAPAAHVLATSSIVRRVCCASAAHSPLMMQLRVEGLTCASCVAHAEEALRRVAGVTEASVSLAEGAAFVEGTAGVEALVRALAEAGYSASPSEGEGADEAKSESTPHAGGRGRGATELRQSLVWLGLALVAAVLGSTEMAGLREGSPWSAALQGLIALALLVVAAKPVLIPGARAILRGRPEMNALVGLGMVASFFASVWALLAGHVEHLHFESTALISAFVLFGRALEARVSRAHSESAGALMAQLPRRAQAVRGGRVVELPIEALRARDLVCVPAGAAIPADGVVEEGQSSLDVSWLTGEALPLAVAPGAAVRAGSLNLEAELRVRVSAAGGDSHLAQVVELLRSAGRRKLGIERVCDRVAGVFTPVVLVLTLLAGAVWWWMEGVDAAVGHVVAVLLVACPCALGIATPAAVTAALARAARLGLLVRDPVALERAAAARHVIFDVTGTLSAARPRLAGIAFAAGTTADEALALAAAVEGASLHPCAGAVRAAAAERGLVLPTVSDRRELPGAGVKAHVDGREVFCGRPEAAVSGAGLNASPGRTPLDPLLASERARFESEGAAVAELCVDGRVVAVFAFSAPLRDDAESVVSALSQRRLEPHLLSGNHPRAVQAIAGRIRVRDARADMTPANKLDALRQLETTGGALMVGDGINDGPALAGASVGIAVHGAAAVASAAGSVVLLRPELGLVVTFVDLSRAARRVIYQNLFLAFAYNLAALPAAMGIFAFELPPTVAALFMSLSCITLMLNASRLLRWKPRFG